MRAPASPAPASRVPQSDTTVDRDPATPSEDAELIDDGQEEVFARTAVQRGFVKDPKALAPEDLARHPKSPLDLRRH